MTESCNEANMLGEAPTLDLQKAVETDAQELARVHVASWHESYLGLVPQEMLDGLSIDARAKQWRKMLAQPAAFENVKVFLARIDGAVIGFGACNSQRSEVLRKQGFDAEISAIYVLKSHQRRGVGKALIRALASHLIRENHQSASLWVLKANMGARQFYEHLGGKVISEKSDTRADVTLHEVAYGWRYLEVLT